MIEEGNQSIRDIPLPPGLSEIEKAEFIAYQESMAELEDEWEALKAGENSDQKDCVALLEEIREKRKQQADERLRLRLEVIDKQVERERKRIEDEHEEAKKALFERIIKAYAQSYNAITAQLKETMSKDDYNAFISANGIDFPIISNESQIKTRMQQPEEPKIRLSTQEAAQDLGIIHTKFSEFSAAEKEKK